MREILFKAKRLGGGEWVEGLYAGMCKTSDRAIMCATEGYFHNDGYVHVDPSTVGQYTSLKDKNGARIFEGDIVRHHVVYPVINDDYFSPENETENEYIRVGHMTIRPSLGVTLNGTMKARFSENEEFTVDKKWSGNVREMHRFGEVIGNIHDKDSGEIDVRPTL